MTEPITILSLGAGVQSSTLALMAKHGEATPMPVAAIFADTGDEPASVMRWLDWLEKQLPFPVIRATAGRFSEHVLAGIAAGTRVSNPPLFVQSDNPDSPGFGLLTRDCTRDFKVAVIKREVRKLLEKHGAKTAEQWIGISLDEVQRMKESGVNYSKHRWPLIEKRMSRHDCLRWMDAHYYPTPPKSACVFCPYRSDAGWKKLKTEDRESFDAAVKFDVAIRRGIHGVKGECFVHRSLKPLGDINFSPDDDQLEFGMMNECEGLCGN